KGDAAIEQEDFHVLRAFRKKLQLDFGVGPGGSLEHRAGQIGAELLERVHGLERDAPQLRDALRVLVRLVERAVGMQRLLDFLVARQGLGVRRAELARGLALRQREAVDSVLGHDARRCGGNPLAHFSLAAHPCDSIIESRPSMAAPLPILGICGTFMGGIAAIASAAGYRVTGCDANVYPPMSDQLKALGIELTEGFGEDQLAIAPDLWVIGNVVTRGNPLMEAILDRGERYVSGPQWLAENVLTGRHVLAVAGTHGKTTVSAMLAWILESAGRSPGFLIGGVPVDFPVSARHTGGDLFVIEADEYDTAFF